jgi:hypothetical protein
MIQRRYRRITSSMLVVVLLLLVALIWGLAWDRNAIANRGVAAETSAKTLAEQIQDLCKSEDPIITDYNICSRADATVKAPADPVLADAATPADGKDGADGRDGRDGKNGLDSLVAGPPGVPGPSGPSVVGPEGPKGESIVGATGPAGPAGPAGAPGTDGADGATGQTGATGATGTEGRGIISVVCTDVPADVTTTPPTKATSEWVLTYTLPPLTDTQPGPCRVAP